MATTTAEGDRASRAAPARGPRLAVWSAPELLWLWQITSPAAEIWGSLSQGRPPSRLVAARVAFGNRMLALRQAPFLSLLVWLSTFVAVRADDDDDDEDDEARPASCDPSPRVTARAGGRRHVHPHLVRGHGRRRHVLLDGLDALPGAPRVPATGAARPRDPRAARRASRKARSGIDRGGLWEAGARTRDRGRAGPRASDVPFRGPSSGARAARAKCRYRGLASGGSLSRGRSRPWGAPGRGPGRPFGGAPAGRRCGRRLLRRRGRRRPGRTR